MILCKLLLKFINCGSHLAYTGVAFSTRRSRQARNTRRKLKMKKKKKKQDKHNNGLSPDDVMYNTRGHNFCVYPRKHHQNLRLCKTISSHVCLFFGAVLHLYDVII